MQFGPVTFFSGFVDYLKTERASTLAYASVVAAPEHWVQFEALAWLQRNRELVGLGGGDLRTPAFDVLAEVRKNDIWLQDCHGKADRTGVAIEFKVVYNNKNFWKKVQELRWDLSQEKQVPEGFDFERVVRYGFAVLIYVRYGNVTGTGYQLLRGTSRGEPCSPEGFLEMFLSETGSREAIYGTLSPGRPITEVQKIVTLDDQPYIDQNAPGCTVWAVMLKAD